MFNLKHLSITFLLLAGLIIVLTAWRLANAEVFSVQTTADQWQQPLTQGNKTLSTISPDGWNVNFSGAEQLFLQIPRDRNDNIVFNADAEKIIAEATVLLADNTSTNESDRIDLLIRKSFPANSGDALATVFDNYQHYLSAIDTLEHASSADTVNEAIARHQVIEAMQQKYFGKTMAQHLFGERNQLNTYLLLRRQIHEDPSLLEESKQQQLQQLAETFHQNSFVLPNAP